MGSADFAASFLAQIYGTLLGFRAASRNPYYFPLLLFSGRPKSPVLPLSRWCLIHQNELLPLIGCADCWGGTLDSPPFFVFFPIPPAFPALLDACQPAHSVCLHPHIARPILLLTALFSYV